MFKFVADSILRGKAYPALAEWDAVPYTDQWRQFVHHWPYTVPCELHEHCGNHQFPFQLNNLNDYPGQDAFYTIGLGFFHFDIDYFDMVPDHVFANKQRILFYYHEGDNPVKIKQRLDHLCGLHDVPTNCYSFVSGNTAADDLPGFAWFADHELLYWQRNQAVPATQINTGPRPFWFTILNRTHKWWRATAMADLQRSGILDLSQWSYNTDLALDDPKDNPLQVEELELEFYLDRFISQGPYRCDDLDAEQHNDHHLHVAKHYTDSYCHVVLETHFDADQSTGTFLTEKTFKPIKHGQPFVIIGAPGSLQALRDLGYRTFDHAIDNSYDLEWDNTKRWRKALRAIKQITWSDPECWFDSCVSDAVHNQQLFLSSKYNRLNNLYDKLLHQLATT